MEKQRKKEEGYGNSAEHTQKYKELYENILEIENSGNVYKRNYKSYNTYVAFIKYKDIDISYMVEQRENNSLIRTLNGKIMKAIIRVEGGGEGKWVSKCEWDEKERYRANRCFAEQIALAKLFNRALSEAYMAWLKYHEDIWVKKDNTEELVYIRKIGFGDIAYLKEVEGGYEGWLFIRNKEIKAGVMKTIDEAQEVLLKIVMKEAINKLKLICESEKDYKLWVKSVEGLNSDE